MRAFSPGPFSKTNGNQAKRNPAGAAATGQYHWTLDVSPTELAGVEKSTTNTRLYRLTAEIRWAPRGRLVLDTLKFSK